MTNFRNQNDKRTSWRDPANERNFHISEKPHIVSVIGTSAVISVTVAVRSC